MAADKIFLTRAGLEELKKELEELKTVKRVEIAEKLKEAISYGDLRENAEYEEARNEQAQVELRIIELEELVKNHEIIEDDEKEVKKGDRVNIGSTVTVSYEDDEGEKIKETFKIVGSTESDIFENKISNESPVGKALIGKKVGETAKGKTGAGEFNFKVVEVK